MRLAVMGLKGHHKPVLAGARLLGDVETVAVSEDDPGYVAKFRKEFPDLAAVPLLADWRQLLDRHRFDACCVGDENHLRPEQVEALLSRGVAVIAEKPLATTWEGLARVRAALAGTGHRLTMLLTMRHDGPFMALQELVRGGAVGAVGQVSCQKSYQIHTRPAWFASRRRLGGIIPYIGVHAVDLTRWITGLEVEEVAAFHGRVGMPQIGETENHATLALRLAGGASASVRLDYLRPMTAGSHGDDRFRVVGDAGLVEYAGGKTLTVVTGGKPPAQVPFPPAANLFAEFVRAVRAGRPHPISEADSLRITEIVLAARDAADRRATLPTRPPGAAQ